ncbi:hypothetical protein E2C01_044956 [Portunus trituberculatus]|uniref:Uncharacterized protein n=1 Tax=Portunus trituberculatus TaxID=210409 RepID=A0A5B7G0I0_PORTR|nr:hypothetical protein [Portunus trituberculatus]
MRLMKPVHQATQPATLSKPGAYQGEEKEEEKEKEEEEERTRRQRQYCFRSYRMLAQTCSGMFN